MGSRLQLGGSIFCSSVPRREGQGREPHNSSEPRGDRKEFHASPSGEPDKQMEDDLVVAPYEFAMLDEGPTNPCLCG